MFLRAKVLRMHLPLLHFLSCDSPVSHFLPHNYIPWDYMVNMHNKRKPNGHWMPPTQSWNIWPCPQCTCLSISRYGCCSLVKLYCLWDSVYLQLKPFSLCFPPLVFRYLLKLLGESSLFFIVYLYIFKASSFVL